MTTLVDGPKIGILVPGQALVLEAMPGTSRTSLLQEALAEVSGPAIWSAFLDCSFRRGGPWAGINDLFRPLVHELEPRRSDLFVRHDFEIAHALPELRTKLEVRNPTLTDQAPAEEKVRNYPADRIYRVLHGLIDLLDTALPELGRTSMVLACDNFDEIGPMGREFFAQLLRRRGSSLRLSLLLAVAPGQGAKTAEAFHRSSDVKIESFELPNDVLPPPSPREAAQQAQALEQKIGTDLTALALHLPELVFLLEISGDVKKLHRFKYEALSLYNTTGLYQEAIHYGEGLLDFARQSGDANAVWAIFLKLFMSHNALRQTDISLRLAEDEVLGKIESAEWKAQLCYFLAMIYARYLPSRDLERAERLLDEGLGHLDVADMPEDRREFQRVFNRNGLALVRFFQGRMPEAITLCQGGFDNLDKHLDRSRHRLHRSVLLYNIAQVFAAMGVHRDAIAHYSAAIDMDPNYSEYYNERGNSFLKLGQVEPARDDYLRAIELSPPYFEVWTNLGQAYRLAGAFPEAVAAYSRALDLEPSHLLAHLGRAQAWDALGDADRALEGYDTTLTLSPDTWEALASRAVLLFGIGRVGESVTDLNRAIELAPGVADLHHNRAFALESLGEVADAARDLQSYLRLSPQAEDRGEVERHWAELLRKLPPPA